MYNIRSVQQVTALASAQLASKWFSTDVVTFIAAKKHHFCFDSNACVFIMSSAYGLTQSSTADLCPAVYHYKFCLLIIRQCLPLESGRYSPE